MKFLPLLVLATSILMSACNPAVRDYGAGGSGSSGAGGGGAGQGGGGGDACELGFANCESSSPDCETKVTDDPKNCGGCGVTCARACVGTTCDDPIQIAAGFDHTCVVTALGDLYCWGRNEAGELGTGSITGQTYSNVPLKVPTAAPVVQVALGGVSLNGTPPMPYAHTCAILTDTTVQCWGANSQGQLGIGSGGWQDKPSTVVSLVGAVEISAGGRHTCALLKSGDLRCWGSNDVGQLGIGAMGSDESAPVLVKAGMKHVSAGRDHTCALSDTGDLYCWGDNGWGRLGIGSQMHQAAPTIVSLTGAERVSAGGEHTCVTKAGELLCWGNGYQGQLGIPNEFTWREKPSDPSAVPSAVFVAAGWQHTAAISSVDGQPYVSGVGVSPGNGQEKGDYLPLATTLTGAVEIAAGRAHTCARTNEGKIYCWGENLNGQLGVVSVADVAIVPVEVILP